MSAGTQPTPAAGYRREVPATAGNTGSRRARLHNVSASVVVAYAVAAIVAALLGDELPAPRWLALHLLLLGAVTNAIFVWSRHFAQALLPARREGDQTAAVRLLVLNVGVVAVVGGVGWDHPRATQLGAAAVVGAVLAHVASLVRMARRSALSGKLRDTVWYYLASGASLAAGAVVGSLMATGRVASAHERLHLAHVHLNLLGWVGLAVLGTTFMLWPAVLRTRMVDNVPQVARQTLILVTGGLALAVAALLASQRALAVVGVGAYLAGVVLALRPFVRTAKQRPPHSAAAWAIAAGTSWLVIALVVDMVGLARGGEHAVAALDHLVPVLALGLAGQVLIGALTFLLPVTLGGGPAGNRRMTAQLEHGWIARTVLGNVGVLLTALPTQGWLQTAGWVTALVGFGAFLPLVVFALVQRRTPVTPRRAPRV